MPEDYIMRLMQQIAALLAALLAKRSRGEIQEAREDLQMLCLHHIGLPLPTVKQLSPDALADHLKAAGANRHLRAVLLAEILIQDAETLEIQGDAAQALPSYVHAFCLLSDVYPILSGEEQVVYRVKLEMLATKLEHLPPNPYTTERLEILRKM